MIEFDNYRKVSYPKTSLSFYSTAIVIIVVVVFFFFFFLTSSRSDWNLVAHHGPFQGIGRYILLKFWKTGTYSTHSYSNTRVEYQSLIALLMLFPYKHNDPSLHTIIFLFWKEPLFSSCFESVYVHSTDSSLSVFLASLFFGCCPDFHCTSDSHIH